MELTFAVFAILPLSLLWWQPKGERRGIAGILPLLTALLPVAAGAVQSALGRRSANQQALAQQHEAERQEGNRQKAAFYNPQAVAGRQQSQALATLQLGRLAGALGGVDRVPASLRNLLQQRRQEQTFEYAPGQTPQAPQAPGGFLTDLVGNLGNFDVAGYNQARNQQTTQNLTNQARRVPPAALAPQPATTLTRR